MSDSNSGKNYVERLVDEDSLRTFLEETLGPVDRYEVERLDAGHSNETVTITWGDRDLILRRPPAGNHAESAHDILREYHIVDAFQETAVPVPTTVLSTDNQDVIGSDFYISERLDGDVIREDEPERFGSPAARELVGKRAIETLADIHCVDYESIGLGEFGKPSGFTERQIDTWKRQWEWATDVTAEYREITGHGRIEEWLRERLPEDSPDSFVHGDYKLDNLMFGTGADPEVVAVFDWELGTLGDPLTDLGYFLVFWREPSDPDPPVPELEHRVMERPGYPSRETLVSIYEDRSGIQFSHHRFYRTLALFKMAGFCEMFYRRYLEGNSDDPLYAAMENRVEPIVDRAIRVMEGEERL